MRRGSQRGGLSLAWEGFAREITTQCMRTQKQLIALFGWVLFVVGESRPVFHEATPLPHIVAPEVLAPVCAPAQHFLCSRALYHGEHDVAQVIEEEAERRRH